MRIAFMVEGSTEKAFVPHLRRFLENRLSGRMPKVDCLPYNGRIPKGEKLRGQARMLLKVNDAVVALTDVYTGTSDFTDAADAKGKMRTWVNGIPNFYPHAAQHDFEAWLLRYWPVIQQVSGHTGHPPGGPPETLNHSKPPSKYIAEAFKRGRKRNYNKAIIANEILKKCDLSIAADQCPELKALLNTFLQLGGAEPLG